MASWLDGMMAISLDALMASWLHGFSIIKRKSSHGATGFVVPCSLLCHGATDMEHVTPTGFRFTFFCGLFIVHLV